MIDLKMIEQADPEIAKMMERELSRQRGHLELIASENFVSPAVMAAAGSHLTNKYAEGYPGKRYYGGCTIIDEIEETARKRACTLFGADHANVQPHSGAQANFAVYFAMLNPGDTIMGMSLSEGGHLTHGSPVNLSGKYYNFVPYGVDAQGYIDYDKVRATALEHKPKMIVCGASAYPRIIRFDRFKEIADECKSLLMVDMAHIAGLVAADLHPDPVPFADFITTTTHKTLRGPRGGMILCKKKYAKAIDKAIFPGTQGGPLEHIIAAKAIAFFEALQPSFKVYQQAILDNAQALAMGLLDNGLTLVSGGTDNHLMLLDLHEENVTGKELERLLDDACITANKNAIPNDPRSPFITSGLRLGTPAVTTRGLNTEDMKVIAELIARIVKDGRVAVSCVREIVTKMCEKYPLYQNDICRCTE